MRGDNTRRGLLRGLDRNATEASRYRSDLNGGPVDIVSRVNNGPALWE